MALLLIEGEEKLPDILGGLNNLSTSKDPLPANGATSIASGKTLEYFSRSLAVTCIGIFLAAALGE